MEAISLKNHTKNRNQKPLPRKNVQIYYFTYYHLWLYTADSSRVAIPHLNGDSDYINFCYIDVSVKHISCNK